jgi:hypothetical protein
VPVPDQEALADRRQLVVVLRLVTGTRGRLLYGEVIDVETGPTGRFIGWHGMTAAVRSWLVRELKEAANADLRPVSRHPDTPVER